MPFNPMHTNQLPIAHSKDLLSQLSLTCLSIHLQLLKLRPMLLLMLPYYVTGVWTWVTSLITARTPINGSTLAGLSVELTADSTCQTVQIFCAHLEGDVLGTAWSMQCHCNNLGSSQHHNWCRREKHRTGPSIWSRRLIQGHYWRWSRSSLSCSLELWR